MKASLTECQMLPRIAKFLIFGAITARALQSPDELHNQYYTIFPSGNRNAASHRWATYVLEHASGMTDEQLRNLFSSFCAVSGSPVYPSPGKRWRMTLPLVSGGQEMTGMMYFCCHPCVCDTYDFIKVDTKTITTKDGPKQYYFTVIGNPCLNPDAFSQTWTDTFSGYQTNLAQSAPDVKCSGSDLERATLSDNGYVILSMFFENGAPGHADSDMAAGKDFQDSSDVKGFCTKRAETGYASGMGEIFRKVALITPVGGPSASFTSSSSDLKEATTPSTSSTTKETTPNWEKLITTSKSPTSGSSTVASSGIASGGESNVDNSNNAKPDPASPSTVTASPSTTATTAVRTSESFMESKKGESTDTAGPSTDTASPSTSGTSEATGFSSNGRNLAGDRITAMFTCLLAVILWTRCI